MTRILTSFGPHLVAANSPLSYEAIRMLIAMGLPLEMAFGHRPWYRFNPEWVKQRAWDPACPCIFRRAP